ncbi:MAG: acyltransferase domain-containing protein, partial [Chloroflexaceae bacterium]|nr:acyltransferase domain-containing protein [Chloroflexaceae bacterium]
MQDTMHHMVQQGELEGIAVIGMSGRFPGAATLQQFWQNLCDGVEGITFFSEPETRAAGVAPELLAHPNYVSAGGVLEGADQFDAAFFGFNPREAELLDPQHRLFLECAWEALECAGYDPERYEGIIGVFGSVSLSTYAMRNIYANPDLVATTGDYQILLSSDKDFIAERVSYKLNLRGPSLTVQTACSSSLVAVHLACRSLLMGESDMVLAGGASVSVPQRAGYLYQEGGILSPDGHCRAFDAQAQGTVRGEGAGIMLLKRLEDAIRDGDTVYAIIKGSAINNDGSFKVGFTAPSVDGQAEAVGLALAMADVDPDTISYIEAHGTGTPLGDPIEVAALTQVFREYTQRTQYCAIGSVKANLGHLDAAAGVAGLIKTVLALKHRMLPPSLHFTQPNPTIDFASSPFFVQQALTPWDNNGSGNGNGSGSYPRRAGVSSFGMGGTNVHVILEEAPVLAPVPADPARSWQAVVLSARSAAALERATENLAEHVRQQPELAIADVAYTLQTGRRAFPHRRVVLCRDCTDLLTAIETQAAHQQWTAHCRTPQRPVAFLFPGQGAQYVRMGAGLYQHEPLVRDLVDECAHLLRPHLAGQDLRDLLFPTSAQAEEAAQQLIQTQYTQPALFVVEYALARLWQAWGIQPAAMIGHSLGEYVAACLAGVLTLPNALALVALRGRLMQAMEPGAMLSVPLTEAQVQPLLSGQVGVAAVNAPALCVLSGPLPAMEAVERRLQQEGVEARRLHTSHAFHSPMMEPMLEAFGAAVGRAVLRPPQIPYLSNVTGTWVTAEEATDPRYWVRHVREAVRFGSGAAVLLEQEELVLLEVGPGRTLSSLVRKQEAARGRTILNSLRHPQDGDGDEGDPTGLVSDEAMMVQALGRLWLAGVAVDWERQWQNQRRQRVPLPTYPFERQRYWIEPPAGSRSASVSAPQRTLDKQPDITRWFYHPVWKQSPPVNNRSSAPGQGQHWLVFASSASLVAQVVEQASVVRHHPVCVYAADRFAHPDEQTYTVNPRRPDDYQALLEALRTSNRVPRRIIHCWQLSAEGSPSSNGVYQPQAQDTGLPSLLLLVQALDRVGWSDPLQVTVVTENLHEITGSEDLRPDGALLQGFGTVIPQEYASLTCTSVDIALPAPAVASVRSWSVRWWRNWPP